MEIVFPFVQEIMTQTLPTSSHSARERARRFLGWDDGADELVDSISGLVRTDDDLQFLATPMHWPRLRAVVGRL
jgi:hypothetical protein